MNKYERILLNPFVSKKKKKETINNIFEFNQCIALFQGESGTDIFKVIYKTDYKGLVEYYKNTPDKLSLAKVIPINTVSDEFLKQILEINDVLHLLYDEDVKNNFKDRIFDIFEKEIKQHISQRTMYSYSYLKDSIEKNYIYNPLREMLFSNLIKIINDGNIHVTDILNFLVIEQLPIEIKNKILYQAKKRIDDFILSDNTLVQLLDENFLSINMDLSIRDKIVNKICNDNNCFSQKMIKILLSSEVLDEIKDTIFKFKGKDIIYELIQNGNFKVEYLAEKRIIDIILNQNIDTRLIMRLLNEYNLSSDLEEKIFNVYKEEIKKLILSQTKSLVFFDNKCIKIIDMKIELIEEDELLEVLFDENISEIAKERLYYKRKNDIDRLLTNENIIDLLFSGNVSIEIKDAVFELKEKKIDEMLSNGNFDYKSYLCQREIKIYDKLFSKILQLMNNDDVIQLLMMLPLDKVELKERIYFSFDGLINMLFLQSNLDDKNSIINCLDGCKNAFLYFLKSNFNFKHEDALFFTDIISFYNNDKYLFITNFDKLKLFLNSCEISEKVFFQYNLNNSYDWLKDVVTIINTNKIDDFIMIKNYFFNNYFSLSINDNEKINNFNIILKNYIKYPELLLSIVNSERELTNEEKKQLEFLFSRNDNIFGDNKPTNIDDCHKITEIFAQKCRNSFVNIDNMSIEEIKNTISLILFNDTLDNIIAKINVYGGAEELEKLEFNNRKYNSLIKDISFMCELTKTVEEIVYCDDVEKLRVIAKNIIQNYNISCDVSYLFTRYDDKMRMIYERDISYNLTKISENSRENVRDEERSRRYGVETFDFSDKEYVLLAHVRSDSEIIEQLVNGESTGKSNFICFSPISYRNQVYFGDGNGIIFGYDEVNSGNFICSSISNMGSNSFIKSYSNEVEKINNRKQRGLLETSAAKEKFNPELLCFREGLKPKYIILPGGREATSEEIEIAKQYGLKFVITQEPKRKIDNPKKIEEKKSQTIKDRDDDLEDLRRLRNTLINVSNKKRRRIAILTDIHGLYEPTLAILHDARKNGVDEIFSLGDNIGTGPNPSEVIDLLEKYGVKSVVGNHELYVTEGVESFRKHLISSGGYDEAIRVSTWTRGQLTKEQLDKVKLYPKMIELMIGGKKLLLCHSTRDYNDGRKIVSTEDYDKIFQGHIHFRNSDGVVDTLRGAGIGYTDDKKGMAYYVILTEKEDGGYIVEEKLVPFDIENLEYDIELSDMNLSDKNKIASWSHAGRR